MQEEFWQPLIGYEGLYLISNLGRIKSLRTNKKYPNGRIMGTTLRQGYPSVILSKNGRWRHKRVHRLVAIQFIPNPKKRKCINHIDGNRLNFQISNLEWCTQSQNLRHDGALKLWREAFKYIRDLPGELDSKSIKYLTSTYKLKRNQTFAKPN